ncbi:extracellular solute-binding protein [Streptomyces sp. NPDC014870]|uniref:extracellular solute-binding protein n=1 Tax=Streptomyces sp. NPDC014870 TaxID=3364925 RepID=UPI0036FAF77E
MSHATGVSRRSVLRGTVLAAAALSAAPVLSACSGSGGSGKGSVGNAGKQLAPWPTYVPFTGAPPQLAPTAQGVQAGYTAYPSNLATANQGGVPGDGSKVRVAVITYGAPPTQKDRNELWQAVNKALGVDLELTVIADADYPTKVATMLAGGDMPDILHIGGGYTLPRETQFIQHSCADLTEYLSGDAVKDHPNLANIPTYAWQGMGRIAGRIYGVPVERPKFGNAWIANRDLLKAVGADDGSWDKVAFAAAAKALRQGRRYGLGASVQNPYALPLHAGSFGAANNFGVKDGRIFSTYGTEEFKEALAFARDLTKAGWYHPDAGSLQLLDLKPKFYDQSVALYQDGLGAVGQGLNQVKGAFDIGLAQPYAGAGRPTTWGGSGLFGYTVLKKAPAARIKMLLRVMDFLAAPFGSKERELFGFGIEGKHFTRDGSGAPVPTDDGTGPGGPGSLALGYIASAPGVLYYAGFPAEVVTKIHQWQSKVAPNLILDATVGLKSDTYGVSGTALKQTITDGALAVVSGRQPISSWDDVVKKWQSSGGSKALDEFSKEYAAVKG